MGDNSEVDIEDGLFDGMEENDSLISVIAKNGGIESKGDPEPDPDPDPLIYQAV